MKTLKFLDYQKLVELNLSSIRAGRSQNLPPERIASDPRERYPVNLHLVHERAGQRDVRLSVLLNNRGQTAWLDVSPQEFAGLPDVEVSEEEWEAVTCTGNPPAAP